MDEANGFNGNADPSVSDAIQRWTGDVDPTGESFETFHYFSMPSAQTGAYWVRADDSNLLSRNAEMLFDADRAVFIDVVTELLDYQIGLNLPNQ